MVLLVNKGAAPVKDSRVWLWGPGCPHEPWKCCLSSLFLYPTLVPLPPMNPQTKELPTPLKQNCWVTLRWLHRAAGEVIIERWKVNDESCS